MIQHNRKPPGLLGGSLSMFFFSMTSFFRHKNFALLKAF
jgi:hypothetical protein